MKNIFTLILSITLLFSCKEKQHSVKETESIQTVGIKDIRSNFEADFNKIEELIQSVNQNTELKLIKSDSTFGDAVVSTIK